MSLTERVKFYESVFGRGILSRDEKNFAVRCPICDPKDPSKKKLNIRTIDDVTHCWVCGFSSRTLAPLLRKFAGREALSTYLEKYTTVKPRVTDLEPEENSKRLVVPPDMRLLTVGSDDDPDVTAIRRYLFGRGVTERDMWYRRLCYSHNQPWYRRVVFMSHDSEGDPNYITSRGIDPKQFPRYVNCDVDRNSVVFQEVNIDWNSPLVLCEGPFDLLRCGENATCLLGSELSEQSLLFDRIVSHNTPIILALDSDTHQKKRPRLVKKLQEYDIDVKLVDLGSYHDPGSAPRSFMIEQIENARPVDWNSMFMDKLSFLTGSH